MNFHTRLVFSYFLLTSISVALISIFVREAFYRSARESALHSMENLALAASNALEEPMKGYYRGEASLDDLRELTARVLGENYGIGYAVYLADGSFLFDSNANVQERDASSAPEVSIAMEADLGIGEMIRADSQGIDTIYLASIVADEEDIYGILSLRTPLSLALRPAQRYFFWLVFVALLVIVGIGAMGGFLAHSLARPVERLALKAEGLSQGNLDTRLKPEGTPELHRLAKAFNSLAGRLQKTLDELRIFVANASHELRTPLTTVKLRVEALRAGALQDPLVAQRFLTDIEEQVDRMSRMVNDLLDLSRLESGMNVIEATPIDLGGIASEVCRAFRVRAAESDIQLKLKVDPNLPEVVADEDQIWRVIMNLVDNAITYTTKGGRVDLRVRVCSDRPAVRLEVQDTGLGISPKDMPHIFERFYRTENTRQRGSRSQGSGLGLAIARSIVENHGGQIGVTSHFGEGSLFWIELPAGTKP